MTDDIDLARLRRRLDMLPMATRAVFLLHRIDGLRYAEIGWRLGIAARDGGGSRPIALYQAQPATERAEATVAAALGGASLGGKWGTPDVIGVLKPRAQDI